MKNRFFKFWLALGLAAPSLTAASALQVHLSAVQPHQILASWEDSDVAHIKAGASSEKEPAGAQIRRFHGPLVSAVLEKAMEKVPSDLKAQVDLVIFRNSGGESVIVPRSLITKYPLLLAQEPEGLTLIAPWTSKPKILQEGLPVDRYTLKGVTRVDLANARETFGGLYLKKRADPVAMRGEKVFIQNCTACHATGPSSLKTGDVGQGHQDGKGGFSVTGVVERDRRALKTYWNSYRGENTSSAK